MALVKTQSTYTRAQQKAKQQQPHTFFKTKMHSCFPIILRGYVELLENLGVDGSFFLCFIAFLWPNFYEQFKSTFLEVIFWNKGFYKCCISDLSVFLGHTACVFLGLCVVKLRSRLCVFINHFNMDFECSFPT